MSVRRWTKKVNLLQKDFLVVPINEDCHWYVAIICFPFQEPPPDAQESSDDHNRWGSTGRMLGTSQEDTTAASSHALTKNDEVLKTAHRRRLRSGDFYFYSYFAPPANK
eukprot:m.126838 g.126838  ORF g.126838 m.126838 type:complete len:109 (-) comp15644_c1_seq3:66-392(-)